MRPFFICLSIALGFNINPVTFAQNAGKEMQSLIQNMQLKKVDIENMINMLQASGQITSDQAEAAIARLSEMDDSEVKGLTMEALSNLHGAQAINVDEIKTKASERKPANLPVSPFSGLAKKYHSSGESREQEVERRKVEKVQQDLLKNAFDIKKFQ